MVQGPLDAAHEHCIRNEKELAASSSCGCFFCCLIFPPRQVCEWLTEMTGGERTAFCPRCGIDAVLGSASGHPITPDFMKQMQRRWFDEMADLPEDYFEEAARTRAQERGGKAP